MKKIFTFILTLTMSCIICLSPVEAKDYCVNESIECSETYHENIQIKKPVSLLHINQVGGCGIIAFLAGLTIVVTQIRKKHA